MKSSKYINGASYKHLGSSVNLVCVSPVWKLCSVCARVVLPFCFPETSGKS